MKKFTRTCENFICENCGHTVNGNGYTNHCPNCLYSKHVDVNPGDRQEECGGLMIPTDVEYKNGTYIIVHQCKKCGFVRRNKISENDNFNEVINLSKNKTAKFMR